MALTVAPDFTDGILTASKLQQLSDAINERTPLFVRKTANETVNNTATLQDDDELFFTAESNAVYPISFILVYLSGTTPDIKFGLTVPSGTTGTWSGIGYDTTGTLLTFGPINITTPLSFGGLGADREARIDAVIVTGSTAGTVRLQFAQATANASNTTLDAGSTMFAVRTS